ncbi:MAG: hypothetical protein M3O46_14615 [Myxococcota bacterium]|nr:hypothetical protein [Myxococcota bacterium]
MRQVPSFAAVVMGAALAFASCKSNDITATTNTISIGQQCIASGSDSGTSGGCAGSAVCSVNYCRTACTSDENCGTGGVCLSGSGGNGCRVEMKEAIALTWRGLLGTTSLRWPSCSNGFVRPITTFS